jgi:hypothetical protein
LLTVTVSLHKVSPQFKLPRVLSSFSGISPICVEAVSKPQIELEGKAKADKKTAITARKRLGRILEDRIGRVQAPQPQFQPMTPDRLSCFGTPVQLHVTTSTVCFALTREAIFRIFDLPKNKFLSVSARRAKRKQFFQLIAFL